MYSKANSLQYCLVNGIQLLILIVISISIHPPNKYDTASIDNLINFLKNMPNKTENKQEIKSF